MIRALKYLFIAGSMGMAIYDLAAKESLLGYTLLLVSGMLLFSGIELIQEKKTGLSIFVFAVSFLMLFNSFQVWSG